MKDDKKRRGLHSAGCHLMEDVRTRYMSRLDWMHSEVTVDEQNSDLVIVDLVIFECYHEIMSREYYEQRVVRRVEQ